MLHHQFVPSTGDGSGAVVFSTGRVQAVGFTVANNTAGNIVANFTNTAGTTFFKLAVLAHDTKHITFATPVDFAGGLKVASLSDSNIQITAYISRDL